MKAVVVFVHGMGLYLQGTTKQKKNNTQKTMIGIPIPSERRCFGYVFGVRIPSTGGVWMSRESFERYVLPFFLCSSNVFQIQAGFPCRI